MADSTVEYPFTDEGLRAALEALGGTGEVVAETLRRLGKRGNRRECADCPVARYLWDLWPDVTSVSVGEHDDIRVERVVVVADSLGYSERVGERITAPEPPGVAQFIERFDDKAHSHYSFLEA